MFTCDEEIGHGVDYVDFERLAADVCYTLDGAGAGDIDTETFSADLATATIRGVNIHPSIAKDRIVNAIRAAAAFVDRLPRDTLAPEVTDGRDGFIHPYVIEGLVAEVKLKLILRDFDTAKLIEQADLLQKIAADVAQDFPGSEINVQITEQYRNMAEGLAKEPRAVEYAIEAHQRLGRQPRLNIIRGGTDRLAVDSPRAAHAESLQRPTQSPLAPGMGLPGRNGAGRRSAGGTRASLGRKSMREAKRRSVCFAGPY